MIRRIIASLVLVVFGCTPTPQTTGPLDELTRQLTSHKERLNQEPMIEFLRRQGKALDHYLGLPGYSGSHYPLELSAIHRLSLGKKPHALLELQLWAIDVPGDCVYRFILLDESTRILDIATVIWPSRLQHRFTLTGLKPPLGEHLRLTVVDLEPKEFWGNFDPPVIVVHESPQTGQVVRTLGWRGDSILGVLKIEKERFVAIEGNPGE